jgi:predicted RNA-binding protein
LDKLTDTVWQWRYMAVRLTYYGGGDDTAQYDNAARAYAKEFWPVLHALRVEISKSYRLVSADMLDHLKSFYQQVVKIDLDLRAIASELDPLQRRILYMDMNHRLFHSVSDDIDHLLEKIAGDLRLAKDQRP